MLTSVIIILNDWKLGFKRLLLAVLLFLGAIYSNKTRLAFGHLVLKDMHRNSQ